MVQNLEKLELATQYRKRGFSYSEIANICGVSKATVSNWLAKKSFSKKVKQDNIRKAGQENKKRLALLNKARATERKKRLLEAEKAAKTEFKHYRTNPLFIAGIMLYLASGDLSSTTRIRLTSANPAEHKIFIKFLTDFCGLSKSEIRFWLLLPSGSSEPSLTTQWSKAIALPKGRFGKAQFISSAKKDPLHIGSGNTIIAGTVLKHKLLYWVQLTLKEL